MALPALTIRDLKLRPVVLPMRRELATRVAVLSEAPLLLIDLITEEGITGRAYLFGYLRRGLPHYAALLRDILEMTRGDQVAPRTLFEKVFKGMTLFGHQGLTTIALSGFDMACWDAMARAQGVPLAVLLGGEIGPIEAYNSNGLGLMGPSEVAAEAEELVAEGDFRAVKVRVGRATLAEDLAVLRAVRQAVGDDILLPTDFNMGLTVAEAIRRGQAFDEEDVYWIEEPIIYDDLEGNAKISQEVATPIQIGENLYGPRALAQALRAEAADYYMPDAQRIGGVTGWLRAAALCQAASIEMSSHTFPEISSHLLAVTPTRHLLEYVDWAEPVLQEPLKPKDGAVMIPDRPGTGIDWDEAAVKKYAVEI
ncbi:MAG: enolase C-terminal domain-like protein [Alphaproteobacteria bacterium]|jgi:mandelate racemase|nr:mandelate racemase [Rhodospirillaceae bacterium]MDP6404947.1 enolase C-terminal domain-like protein [Alphaproteobacteria bacterium]MDP6621151.1 enolase C-terminal domain-like protein [Alphaproteobacteria bacterium]|tara:strand:- start:599 stop:1699 length:1101 start_codon:yes stop_codon:yes gene_type:complete